MLSKREKEQILFKFNKTEFNFLEDRTIHQLFEEQAKKIPDKIAVIFEDQQLTYRELNKKANQLAHFLKKRKVF